MIFVTKRRDESPIFYGYVNAVWGRELPNGNKVHMYSVGTSEKQRDGSFRHSSWSCDLIGQARRNAEVRPLSKGDKIAVYSLKLTNVSRKKEDGTWDKPFLRVSINDYDLAGDNNFANNQSQEEDLAY